MKRQPLRCVHYIIVELAISCIAFAFADRLKQDVNELLLQPQYSLHPQQQQAETAAEPSLALSILSAVQITPTARQAHPTAAATSSHQLAGVQEKLTTLVLLHFLRSVTSVRDSSGHT